MELNRPASRPASTQTTPMKEQINCPASSSSTTQTILMEKNLKPEKKVEEKTQQKFVHFDTSRNIDQASEVNSIRTPTTQITSLINNHQ